MAAAYFQNGINHPADFELFIRSLPPRRSYLIAAGLEQALDYLATLRFSDDEVDYLREHPAFTNVSREFFDYLKELRFTGDVWALPEGTPVFAMEPILRVSGPIIEAQIVETFLLSTINFQTLIASKASRVVTAARGRSVVDFGTRRAHGPEAGLLAARAAYIAGCEGTSNVEAGRLFGIPTFGTLAHSFVMAFEDEIESFRAFLRAFPATATLLVDTYDTVAALRRMIAEIGPPIPAIRLDSGDMLELSLEARRILDQAGMTSTRIFASGDLNEDRISELLESGAPIDGFGVGTELATSLDWPALNGVYKLVSVRHGGSRSLRMKRSPDKPMYPGVKQVWRYADERGIYNHDVVALSDEEQPSTGSSRPLLEWLMAGGRILDDQGERARLEIARARAAAELKRLPPRLTRVESASLEDYEVTFSAKLERARGTLEEKLPGAGY